MALLHCFPSQISLLQLQSHRQFPIPNPSVSETPIPPSISPLISSISLSAPTNLHYPSLQSLRCSSSSSFSVHDASPFTKIFIKGNFFLLNGGQICSGSLAILLIFHSFQLSDKFIHRAES